MSTPQPDAKKDFSLREFGGVNTQSPRFMIDDKEFAWLENVMPIAPGALQVIPGASTAIALLPGLGAGVTCYYMESGVINTLSIMLMFMSDGSLYAVDLNSGFLVKVAVSGTFSNTGTRATAYSNQRFLIVDPVFGYFDWVPGVFSGYLVAGTLTAYANTIGSITISSGGNGFNASPTILPATGTATFTSTIGVNGLTALNAAGTLYRIGDVLTVALGTLAPAVAPSTATYSASMIVSSINTSTGAITGWNLQLPGLYTNATPASAAGAVTTPIATPGVVNWTNHGLLAGQSFLTTGTWPTGVTNGTTYYVIATGLTANSFQMSATLGGGAVAFSVSAGSGQIVTPSLLSVPVTGGYGSGATFTLNYSINSVTVVKPTPQQYPTAPVLLISPNESITTSGFYGTAPTNPNALTGGGGDGLKRLNVTYGIVPFSGVFIGYSTYGGYSIGDIVTVVGGTSTSPATFKVLSFFQIGGTPLTYGWNLQPVTQGNYTAFPSMSVSGTSLYAPGSGYAVNDVLTFVGGSFATAATIKVTSTNGIFNGNGITGFTVLSGGAYFDSTTTAFNVTGGHGIGATFSSTTYAYGTVTQTTGGTGTGMTINALALGAVSFTETTSGSGYVAGQVMTLAGGAYIGSNLGKLTVSNVGGGGVGAILTANLSSSVAGDSIAVYAGRVWIVATNSRTVVFSAPGSYQDFTVGSSGGSLIITDNALKSNIKAMIPINDYLYFTGVSSLHMLSGLSVQSGITMFTLNVVSSSSGTDFRDGILVYFRSLLYVSDYGIYGMTGVSPSRISDPLDGVFSLIDLTKNISCGQAIILGQLCACFLTSYTDPVYGSRPLILVFFNKKWFFSTQLNPNVFIASAIINDAPTLYGTDGTALYQLFANNNNVFGTTHTIKTKQWDFGTPLINKQVFKFGVETTAPSALSAALTIDTPTGSSPYTMKTPFGGYNFFKTTADGFGDYVGITLTSNTPNVVYNGFHLQFEGRAPWL